MKQIKGLSWDKDFKKYFNKDHQHHIEIGKVQSVFENVINLTTKENEIYTVSNKKVDDAPYTLKIDKVGSFNKTIKSGMAVIKTNEGIKIGDILIDLSEVKLENFKNQTVEEYSEKIIIENILLFNHLIRVIGNKGGCQYYYEKRFLGINRQSSLIEKELAKRIVVFENHLKTGKLAKENIQNLLGFGIGLTPSGDDFLTGFLTVVGLFRRNEELFSSLKEFIKFPITSTTEISSAMIKVATERKSRQYLTNFIYSFFKNDKVNFHHSLRNILKIGSSSGTDMSVGVVIGLMYTIENKKMKLKGSI